MLPAHAADRTLAARGARRADVLRHLASGVKVSLGRDGPAAIIAGETLRAERTALGQADVGTSRLREAADVAEAALAEVNAGLLRLRELAGESHSLSSPAERAAIALEADTILGDLDRLLAGTEYRGRPLFRAPPVLTPPTPPPAPVPIAHYSFDTADLGDDATGNGHTGTNVGATPVGGVNGGAAAFGGNGFIDLPTGLMDTEAGAVSFHFRSDGIPTTAPTVGIAYYFTDQPGGDGLGPERELQAHLRVDGRFGAQINRRDASYPYSVNLIPATSFDDGQWHHVTMAWRRGPDPRVDLYVDGVAAASRAREVGFYGDSAGHRLGAPLHPTRRHFTGDLDEVELYDRYLDPTEVMNGYLDALPRPIVSGVNRPDLGTMTGDPALGEQQQILEFNVGGKVRRTLALRIGELQLSDLGSAGTKLTDLRTGGSAGLAEQATADQAAATVDAAIEQVTTLRGTLGARTRYVADPAQRQADGQGLQLADAHGRIVDTRVAEATAELARLDVLRATAPGVRAAVTQQARRVLDLLG